MTKSVDLIKDIKKRALKLLPVIFAASGFCAGALVRFIVPSGVWSLPAPDMTSAFLAESPLAAVIDCLSGELKYVLLIYLLGYCAFGGAAPSAVAAFRAALAGYSAAYMLDGRYGVTVYFAHTGVSIFVLMLYCALAASSAEHSRSLFGGGEGKRESGALSYTARCLFFTGIIFAALMIRQLLLAFIHA